MNTPWFNAPAPLLPEILALNAQWMGDKPVLVCDQQSLSWADFHARVCQVANGLIEVGIKPGDRVVVLMNNSIDMVCVMFGILAAGGVTVPINTLVSDRALAPMIEDCAAKAVFSCQDNADRLAQAQKVCEQVLAAAWLCSGPVAGSEPQTWRAFEPWRKEQSTIDPAIALKDEDECNIIYSSGTTGQPKGIVHTHRRRLDWFYDLAIALRYDRATINLCAIGLFSNISWVGLGCTFLTGGTLVIMRSFDAGRWLNLVAQYQVTHSAMVPVMFQRIVEHDELDPKSVASIKSLMCCGSPLSPELKQTVMKQLAPGLVELYGLTEGLITTLDPEDAVTRPSSVGKPLMGTELRILDDNNECCPAGKSGEIVGRGRILMSGYNNRPDANEETTWTDARGHRWLRTGDIGYLDDAGFLYLVDRKKDMIISGGQNVYPADIETVAALYPDVSEVAVIGIDHPQWGETPLALVVTRTRSNFDGEALCQFVNQNVGKHQRLAGAVCVESLPRNANGKILKRTLREQYKNWLTTEKP